MSRRRRAGPVGPSHERWLVSYADFITLLFAFFVVMYAISTLNEGKYRVLGDSLVYAFRHDRVVSSAANAAIATPRLPTPTRTATGIAEQARHGRELKLAGVAERIKTALEPLARDGGVRLRPSPQGLVVEISASVLFAPAQASLRPESMEALQAVARILNDIPNQVNVEGHTDTLPIATAQYPSNWELSGARSSSVVRLFAANGVAPARLSAIGYADNRPAGPNDTPQGRADNRRVTLLVLAQAQPLAGSSAQEASAMKGKDAAHGPQ